MSAPVRAVFTEKMKNGNFTKPAENSCFGPAQKRIEKTTKKENRTNTYENELYFEAKEEELRTYETETKEEVGIDRKFGGFDSVQTNDKAFDTGGKTSQSAQNFDSKQGEELMQETEPEENTEINCETKEKLNVEESQVKEEIFVPKIKAYFVISESDSINLEDVANHYRLSYAQVNKTSDLIPTLNKISQGNNLSNAVVIKSTQISTSALSQLPKTVKAHFIFLQNKVDQPPFMEETRKYMTQLEKQLGNVLSISQVYFERRDSSRKITTSLEVILDNPVLDILQVY